MCVRERLIGHLRTCRALKQRLASNAHREQRRERAKYYLMLRKTAERVTTFASSLDGSRFSAREYQLGPVAYVDCQRYGWLSPVVPESDCAPPELRKTQNIAVPGKPLFKLMRSRCCTSEKSCFRLLRSSCFLLLRSGRLQQNGVKIDKK